MTAPFALHLRDLRLRCGLTQEEMARVVGYEQSYMSSLERGMKKPTPEFLWRLAEKLELSEEDRQELAKQVATSRNRFELKPEATTETFRFCNDLFEKIDQLHPTLISALHAMIMVENQAKPSSELYQQRLKRQTIKELQM